MNADQLLGELRARGVVLEAAGDRLRVDAPRGAITPELREALTAHKAEVLALLAVPDKEIAWRVEAMLPQIPGNGAIPFLVAREAVEPSSNCCHSCGDSMNGVSGYVCGPCSRAKDQALEIALNKRSEAIFTEH